MSDDKEEGGYDLRRSSLAIGYLYPTIVDKHNRIIDGILRLKIDPKWPCFKLSHIETMTDYLMARIVSNVFRRQVTDEEVAELLGELAQETRWTTQEIADRLGSIREWVLRHIPDEYREGAKWRGVRSESAALENGSGVFEVEKPFLTCPTPTKMALEALKRALELEKGSMQYKKSGDMVYLVVYNADNKKREWHQIGRWIYLKRLLSRSLRRKEA